MKKFAQILLAMSFLTATAAQADSWTFDNTQNKLIDNTTCNCTWSFDDE